MERMLNVIKMRLRVQIKFALLSIFSIATISCAHVPKFPTDIKVWETAYEKPTASKPQGQYFCGEYAVDDKKVTSVKDVKFKPVMDHELHQCIGVFGFKGADFPAVLDWAERLEDYYKKRLEECRAK